MYRKHRPVLELKNSPDPLDAYRHFVQHFRIAQGPPVADPDYEPLKELVAEDFYPLIRGRLQEFFVDRGFVRTPPEPHILEMIGVDLDEKVDLFEENVEVMRSCFKENTELRTIEGELLDDEVFYFAEDVYMVFRDGRWRLGFIDAFGTEGEEAAECKELFEG